MKEGSNVIHLMDVNEENWRLKLAVSEDQKSFVASLPVLLARAYAYRNHHSRAFIVCDDELPVGAGLYYDCPELNAYDFSQFFIDQHHQRRGYGRAAAALVLEEMKRADRYGKVVLCYIEGNEAARRLYEQFGFAEIDRDEDEIILEAALH